MESSYHDAAIARYQYIKTALDPSVIGSGSIDPSDASEVAGMVRGWLSSIIEAEGLAPSSPLPRGVTEYDWFDGYIAASYEAGYEYGVSALEEVGESRPTPGLEQSPLHRQSQKELHQRQRTYWNALADDVAADTRRRVSEEVSDGATAEDVADVVVDRLEKVAENRVRQITTFEPAWAYNRGALVEFHDAESAGADIDVEIVLVDDERRCATCWESRGSLYSVDAAINLMESNGFPWHPECRCLVAPSV